MMFTLLLVLLGVTNSLEGPWRNPSYSPIDNIDTALRGYNLYTAEPFTAAQIDPGWRQLIFESTKRNPDGTISLQTGIDATVDLSCKTSTDESIISSMEEYRKDQIQNTVMGTDWSIGPDMEVTAELDVGPLKVGVKKKIEPFIQDQESDTKRLTQLERFFTEERGVLVKLEATCLNNKIMLDRYHLPEFKPGFIASVRKLYNSTSKEQRIQEFRNFIKDYGTHYSIETHLGARMIYNRRYTARERQILKHDGLLDCSKHESKISLFASVRQHSNRCKQNSENGTNDVGMMVAREETLTFGSRPGSKTTDWANQELTGQVPIKQRLMPIWKLFEQHSLSQIDDNMVESEFLPWIRELYDDICNIMAYSCHGANPCGVIGANYACRLEEHCIRLWFAEKGQKRYHCEDVKPMVHWVRVSSATGYQVKLTELGSDLQIRKYADQCVLRYCNTSFPEAPNPDGTFLFEVTPLFGNPPYAAFGNMGRRIWTLDWFPRREATIQFRRIEEVSSYYVNVRDLATMRTLTHYVTQCDSYLTVMQRSVCEAGLGKMVGGDEEVIHNILKATEVRCYYSPYRSKWRDPIGTRIREFVEPEASPLDTFTSKCSYGFTAEAGDYDIIVVANSTNSHSVVQQFRIKV